MVRVQSLAAGPDEAVEGLGMARTPQREWRIVLRIRIEEWWPGNCRDPAPDPDDSDTDDDDDDDADVCWRRAARQTEMTAAQAAA